MHVLLIMQHILDQSIIYVGTCWTLPWAAIVCHPLWNWVATGLMATGALFLLWTSWKVVDYLLKYQAALRAEAYRQQVAPEETMKQVRWTGDESMVQGAGDGDVAAQIRDELDRRRRQERGMLPRSPKTSQ